MMQNELPFIGWPAIALIAFLVLKRLDMIIYAFGKKLPGENEKELAVYNRIRDEVLKESKNEPITEEQRMTILKAYWKEMGKQRHKQFINKQLNNSMSRIKFRDIRMGNANKGRLEIINSIISEYQKDGYILTLRQLYYQLVSRDVIPNKKTEYAKLSILLKEGRMAGIVDWAAIEDRLRVPKSPASFDSPEDILQAAIGQYALPRQKGQDTYMEVWVEKDALSGVLSRVTSKYHVPIMVNRGYSSASAMFDSYQRFKSASKYRNQQVKVIYLGDFDPSGVDMIRDIDDRISEFISGDDDYANKSGFRFSIESIALTRKQIKFYNPPPNPAKITDPRAKDYIAKYGPTSWEVDALPPDVLNKLLDEAIRNHMQEDLYDEIVGREDADKQRLRSLVQYL